MKWIGVRMPLSISDIAALEKELNIKLPDDYKAQIGHINGGALKNAYVNLPRLGEVPYSRNVSLHRDAKAGIFDLIDAVNDGDIKLFPFASVGNGDYFCFDVRSGTVVLYLHELQATQYVCDSFTDLLNRIICE